MRDAADVAGVAVADVPDVGSSSRRARSRPTTSRGCSTSRTSTATSTWTSRATAPWCRSSLRAEDGSSADCLGRSAERGGPRGAAGAHPACRHQARPVSAAGSCSTSAAFGRASVPSSPRSAGRAAERAAATREPVRLRAHEPVRAQGRPRCRRRRWAAQRVRGRGAGAARRRPAGLRRMPAPAGAPSRERCRRRLRRPAGAGEVVRRLPRNRGCAAWSARPARGLPTVGATRPQLRGGHGPLS